MTPAPTASPDGDEAGPRDERSVCSPCRGTGTVISALGGDPHEITCPWCGGSGEFVAGRDAQAPDAPAADS